MGMTGVTLYKLCPTFTVSTNARSGGATLVFDATVGWSHSQLAASSRAWKGERGGDVYLPRSGDLVVEHCTSDSVSASDKSIAEI